MDLENWRRVIEEERVAAVAVGLLLVASVLAVASYAWNGLELAFGLDGGLLAGGGLIVAGAILFFDLLREYAES